MRLEDLETELRAERPEASEDFSRRLDEWAAAGFPRDERPGSPRVPAGRRVQTWLRSLGGATPPRRVIGSVGALAATVAIVGVVLAQEPDGGDGEVSLGDTPSVEQSTVEAPELNDAAVPDEEAAPFSGPAPDALDRGDVIRDPDNRKVERDAEITLATPAADVPDLSDDVIGVVNTHDGIVESSEVEGRGEKASAEFELVIPTNELDAALDDLSGLANVAELNEGSVDITRGFVSAEDELADDRAALRSLRAQLEAASTPEETEALRAQVAAASATVADSQAEFQRLQQRSRLAGVSVSIIANESADSPGASDDEDSSAGWGLGDAVGDAGRLLTVIGGVLVVAAAAALPLGGLVALILWARALHARRARELALDA